MFHILIVEDDKELSELFSTILVKSGYKTSSAKDGVEALDVLDKEYIDLIISDIMMPNMDGFELIQAIRDAQLLKKAFKISSTVFCLALMIIWLSQLMLMKWY